MRKLLISVSILSLGLTACAQQEDETADLAQADQMEKSAMKSLDQSDANSEMEAEETPAEQRAPIAAAPPVVPVPVETTDAPPSDEPQGRASMPDFTYSYDYKFEAPAGEVGRLQDAHVAACDNMGQQQCRLANYNQDASGFGGTTASLEFYVASDKIRALADKMSTIARDYGGERVEANIVGTNTTERLDQVQLEVTNNLAEKERLEAIINDRRSSREAKNVAAQQLAALSPRINLSQRRLDNVASELGFTKMDVSYSSSSLFGPWLPYVLIVLLLAVIGAGIYRSQNGKLPEPVPA